MPSFDAVLEPDFVELRNAVDQSNKEIGTRFDFKGSGARIDLTEKGAKERDLMLHADSDFQIGQVKDILLAKLAKRGVDVRFLDDSAKIEKVGGDKVRQPVAVKCGIDSELGKKIQQLVKQSKLKVQAAMAENILAGRVVRAPVWGMPFIAGVCILTGILMGGVFVAARSAWTMLIGTAVIAGALVSGATLLFGMFSMLIPPSAPLVVVAALFTSFSMARYAIERRRAYAWFKQTENARQVTIESMAAVAETRDPETGAHIKRTQHYVRAIAMELWRSGQHTGTLTPTYIDLLFASAPLHDIGKVGVPDHILLKPGKLTDEEFMLMKRHADFGRSIVSSTERLIDGENFLVLAGEIAATHHEKWDGSGYPLGLAGENIPLSGRIMAVADVYDALISRRCYKAPFSHEESTRLMREQRGAAFDPVVLDAFFAIEDEILQIAATYRDETDAPQDR